METKKAKFRKLSGDHEKMEMEVLLNRSAGLNGSGGGSEYNMMMSGAEDDDEEDDDGQPNVFRQKCERLSRELELAKQRLAQQHEDDLEQTVTLKKQLEKKLNDAYEEVEEQRQVVAQWKRKSQRLAAELSDTRLLHEDQTNRNAVLEKKQRKFDTELQLLHDELRQERGNKERAMRERDAAITDKLTSEQALQVSSSLFLHFSHALNSSHFGISDIRLLLLLLLWACQLQPTSFLGGNEKRDGPVVADGSYGKWHSHSPKFFPT